MTSLLETAAIPQTRRETLRHAFPLARAEMRRVTRHPLIGVGIGLTILAGRFFVGRATDLYQEDALLGLLVWPLAGMTLIVANLAASRSRRHDVEELFEATPASPATRTIAHLLSLAGPVLLAAFLVTALIVISYLTGATGRPSPAELALGVALVGCAGAVGILFDRVAGKAFLTPLVVIGIGILEGQMASSHRGRTWHLLAPWIPGSETPRELWVRPSGAHLIYIIGIGGLLSCAAVLRHRRSRRVIVATIAAAAVTVAAGMYELRFPTPQQVAASVAFVAHPETVQRCEQAGTVRYCFYPRFQAARVWRPAVDGVLSRVPSGVRGRELVIAQRVRGSDIGLLEPEARSALPFVVAKEGSYVWPDDGAIHTDMGWCTGADVGNCEFALATKVAAWAVGFPLAAQADPEPLPEGARTIAYDSTGQARAVVALWLAGAATPYTNLALRPIPVQPSSGSGCVSLCAPSGVEPPYRMAFCDSQDEASVGFAPTELAYARALLRLAVDHVTSVVNAHWEELVDARTRSARIVALFGLGSPDPSLLAAPAILGC
jgi:hypothetical protein